MTRVLAQIGLVAVGSACGGLARWGVAVAAARLLGTAFPYGTLVVNVVGSLLLGWMSTLLAERTLTVQPAWLAAGDLRLALGVGFAGAFTTFSTFQWETHGLLRDGDYLLTTAYLLGSIVLGLLAIRLGVYLARGF